MTTILVVEDDDAIRSNVSRLLRLEGHEIVTAANGVLGLERARRAQPDVVITDLGMPEMDGFALVEAIRADPALAATPVLLLTALDDRASMRKGMVAGADDFLAKPFTRVELLDALAGLLKKKVRIERSIEHAVQAREAQLRQAFADSLAGRRLPDRIGLDAPEGAVADQVLRAVVLFADIRNFTTLAERLSSAQVAEMLTHYFEGASAPVLEAGGRHLKFLGDGLMAVFVDDGSALSAARRAVSAGLAMALCVQDFRAWMERRFSSRRLPPFAVGIGLHAGEVTLCRVGPQDSRDTTAIGDTVNVAARLEAASKELGWTIVASAAVLAQAGEGVKTGGMTSLEVRGKQGWVEVGEVLGLEATGQDRRHAAVASLVERAGELGAALQVNSEITARAVKGALQSRLAALKAHRFTPGQEPLRLRGYRLTRKVGSGGMTEVYLAERETDGLEVVLKVLDASGPGAGRHLSRFIQEYTLLSRIQHPNVVRIHDQGFTDDHAFIAMEYFPLGDLRAEVGTMDAARALAVLQQVAHALAAVHACGIIHRDLKPENVMRRADGSVALADFGIAKSLGAADNLELTRTRHGDVVGTPYYLSPEQAAGREITPASDLYSLGVLLFELLTGTRPFRADSLDQLLALHLMAPTPRLPAQHEDLQGVLDRLMAKVPEARFATAQALLDELQSRPFLQTVRTAPPG